MGSCKCALPAFRANLFFVFFVYSVFFPNRSGLVPNQTWRIRLNRIRGWPAFLMKTLSIAVVARCLALAGGVSVSAQTWTPTSAPTNGWASIACSADGTRVIACAGGSPVYEIPSGIYVSPDGGTNWMLTTAPTTYWASVACSADGTNLVAVSGTISRLGGIFTSSDGGLTWVSNRVAAQHWQSVASSADGSRLFAATTTGSLYTSTNAGAIWASNPAPAGISFVATSADGRRLVALPGGWGSGSNQVFTSTNAGATWDTHWTQNDSLTARIWRAAASSADGKVLAVAEGSGNTFGHVYTSTDFGATWASNDLPVLSWQTVALSADGTRMVAAAWTDSGKPTGPVYTSTDRGRSWISNSLPDSAWNGLACSADGNKVVAACAGNDLSTMGSGQIWASQTTALPSLTISPSSSNLIVSWPVPSTSFVLQQNTDLRATNRVTVFDTPALNLTNLQYQVTLPPTNSRGYFRLSTP